MGTTDINDREFKIAVLKILNEIRKIETGNLMHAEKKLMNKMSALPKRLKP